MPGKSLSEVVRIMAFSVFPIIDRQTGQVQFRAEGRWHTSYVSRPAQLEALISRATRRPQYDPRTQELIVHIAAPHKPAGERFTFRLAKFPDLRVPTKLKG